MNENRAVFFDLFGTLLVYGDMKRAWEDWLDAFHGWALGEGFDISRDGFATSCEGFFDRPEPPRREGLTVLEGRIHAFCLDLGWLPPRGTLGRAAEAMIEAWQKQVLPDPEAEAVLDALGRTKKLALVSNFDHHPHVHRLLEDLGLKPRFDAVVVSSEVGAKKPDPLIFSVALRRTGSEPGSTVHVGDAPEDVRGARAAGID
ncbi:MAG: HAD family hydrolase, partial [Planctomycetota bacterium]